ncbi:hypothetical protein LWI29_026280 [Acer saccharum]|uniref:Uncharacterized protein n=1 Tax=Acer saccharum TaxID=4024 RepID=A0AA39V931_ACESA|nr:hypothetical protein LWI29_026280 [Acer saccharum]
MVTVLWFGKLSDIINTPYVGNANSIQERYWLGEEGHELKLSTVYDRFLARNFLEPDDWLKMALLLIANNVLFGQPYDKKVSNWLFNLVDDLNAFNSFVRGHYVWAMEAVETLIDGFGLRLEHTLPRMRRWTMHKRPLNFVKTISDLEANIHSGKAQVLEVLEATDDEAQKDYMVGVDFDMLVDPQFKPPMEMEMEMKENNESLDDLDDGNDGDDGDDGGDRAPTWKTAVKRKAPKKKKKTSAPLTDVTDQSLHVKEVGTSAAKELPPTAMKDVAPTVEKEVAGSVLVSGDMRVSYNYAAEED